MEPKPISHCERAYNLGLLMGFNGTLIKEGEIPSLLSAKKITLKAVTLRYFRDGLSEGLKDRKNTGEKQEVSDEN